MRPWLLVLATTVGVCLWARPAVAIPVFAHRYGFSCRQCHSTVPHLNSFGRAFLANGFRLGDRGRNGVFPVAVKVNLAYSSAKDPTGLPKAIVDEVEILTGGAIGKNASFFLEQYAVDGGRPGRPRDMWVQLDRDDLHVRAGEFTLPLPVDPETQRDTEAHYALYDQTIGRNTFNFFDPRIGIDAFATDARTGIEARAIVAQSYDRGGGVPASGDDLMGSLSKQIGDVTLSTYRYQGQRRLTPDVDRFRRQGFAATLTGGRFALTGVLQTGEDSSATSTGLPVHSSGGFLQATYWTNSALAFVARYDGTNDALSGTQRQSVFSVIVRPRRNMRLTIEDQFTAHNHQILNTGLMFAY